MHDSAWGGEYYFLDQAVHRLNPKQRAELHKKHIGFVFQSYHLLDNLTVYENLEIPLSYRNVSRKDRQGMVADVLDRFQIVGKKDLYPNQLSGGQQQLVGVARAVIANPQVVLADEPTGNLHSAQGKEIMELFRTLNDGGATIVQVTHSEVNASYGTRIINLRDGWIVDDSPPEDPFPHLPLPVAPPYPRGGRPAPFLPAREGCRKPRGGSGGFVFIRGGPGGSAALELTISPTATYSRETGIWRAPGEKARFVSCVRSARQRGGTSLVTHRQGRGVRLLDAVFAGVGGGVCLGVSAKAEGGDRFRWLRELAAGGLDGVVAKRLALPYRSGERDGMVKIKRVQTADCVVGGFRYGQGTREIGCCSRSVPSRWSTQRSTEWVPLDPQLVCEVRYDHFSGDRFRHGTKFLRWRPDKLPRRCTVDQVTPPSRGRALSKLIRFSANSPCDRRHET